VRPKLSAKGEKKVKERRSALATRSEPSLPVITERFSFLPGRDLNSGLFCDGVFKIGSQE
jgi:hypothetical protein